jgi:hypothetical protein
MEKTKERKIRLHPRLSQLGIGMMLLVGICLLTGCDDFVDFVIENYSTQEVTVTIARREYRLRPCSVQVHMSNSVGPGEPIPVEIKDDFGNTEQRALAASDGVVRVRIPQKEAGDCPAPIGSYILIVKNFADQEITLWQKDTKLGDIGTFHMRGAQTFGPLPGGWQDLDSLSARSRDGKTLPLHYTIDYKLGQIPEFTMEVLRESQY